MLAAHVYYVIHEQMSIRYHLIDYYIMEYSKSIIILFEWNSIIFKYDHVIYTVASIQLLLYIDNLIIKNKNKKSLRNSVKHPVLDF